MNENYFNVIRVYPPTSGLYEWSSMSSEFLDMVGYQRWVSLRESHAVKETLEVYVRTDLDINQVTEIRSELTEGISKYLSELLLNAERKFDESFKDQAAWNQWQSDKVSARRDANEKFTDILLENYTKLEFNETV